MVPLNLNKPASSLVNGEMLVLLDIIRNDLKCGAEIGGRGTFRNPSRATNAKSANENGAQVTDAICDWLTKGFD